MASVSRRRGSPARTRRVAGLVLFARGAILRAGGSAILAARWPLLLATIGLVAFVSGIEPPWIAWVATGWASVVFAWSSWRHLADPKEWAGTPICRGVHPGRCALTIDVGETEQPGALALALFLQQRGVSATFFVDLRPARRDGSVPTDTAGAESRFRDLGHEVGTLYAPEAGRGLVRATAPWRIRSQVGWIGWSVRLGPKASILAAERVVGTDIVRISATTKPVILAEWLADWDRRAVVAGTVTRSLLPPA